MSFRACDSSRRSYLNFYFQILSSYGLLIPSYSSESPCIAKNARLTQANDKKLMEDLNLDYKKDIMDRSHLNIYGSYKVMDHLIPYMIKK